MAGFDSKITILPNQNFGIFTSANGPAYGSYTFQQELHFVMYDLFVNLTFTGQSLFVKKRHETTTKPHLKQHKDSFIKVLVSNYLGIFGHNLFGNLTVSQDIEGRVKHLEGGLFCGCFNFELDN